MIELKYTTTVPKWTPSYPPKPDTITNAALNSSVHTQENRPHTAGSTTDENHNPHPNRPQDDQVLQEILSVLIERTKELWSEMKISKKEQSFYKQTLCSLPAESIEQCHELSKYIELLEDYRTSTTQVIQAIRRREAAVSRCFDVIMAIHRKISHLSSSTPNLTATSSSSHAFGPNATSSSLHSSFPLNSTQTTHASASSLSSAARSDFFWKEEFLSVLYEIRVTTLEVIKQIQQWRKLLWRPYGFVWKDTNYLLKMKYDMNFLSTDLGKELCDLMTLSSSDLQCILFAQGTNTNSNNGNSNHNTMSSTIRTTSTASKSPLPRSSANNHRITSVIDQEELHYGSPEHTTLEENDPYRYHQQYVQQLLLDYRKAFEFQELQDASLVILEEEMIQQAIGKEQVALKDKGVFIPLLRPKPNVAAGSTGKKGMNATGSSARRGVGDSMDNDIAASSSASKATNKVPFANDKQSLTNTPEGKKKGTGRPGSAVGGSRTSNEQSNSATKQKATNGETEEERGPEEYGEEDEEMYSPMKDYADDF